MAGEEGDDARAGPKVVPLPERDDEAAKIEEFRRDMPKLIERTRTIAAYRRAAYLAYIEAGFNEEQALILCRG